ncbi:MAG: transcription-repair coupling factor [Clostridia bacterium]|nr:transcription-repair coupling factor [Clostridia bacterium]
MSNALLAALSSPLLDTLRETLTCGKSAAVTGLGESLAAALAVRMAEDTGRRVLIVTPSDLRALHTGEDAAQLLGSGAATLTGGEIDLTRGSASQESAWRRLDCLQRVALGETRVLTVSADALQQRMGSPACFREAILRLQPGDRGEPADLLDRLVRMGYERVSLVEGKGQCALRGDILDIYPPAAPQAYRIEYFGDEVDSIRTFDPLSQRSQEHVEAALIGPACEVLIPEVERPEAARRMREALGAVSDREDSLLRPDLPPLPEDEEEDAAPEAEEKPLSVTRQTELERRTAALLADADQVAEGLPFRRIRAWLPVLQPRSWSLTDWYQPQLVFFCEPDQLRQRFQDRQKSFAQDLLAAMDRGEAVREQEGLLLPWEEASAPLSRLPYAACTALLRGMGGLTPDTALNLEATGVESYRSQLRLLAQDLQAWQERGWTVALLSGGVARGQRLAASLAEFGVTAAFLEEAQALPRGEISILPMTLSAGFLWPEASLAVVSDTELWGAGYRKAKSRRSSGEKLSAFTDLKPGDYVVHEDHGVGIYKGVVRLQQEGAWRDYMLLQYDGTDQLYVPVESFQRVQRYIGNPAQAPKLNRLNGTEWGRQKGRVKEGLRKLAFDLTALYARRAHQPGHAFAPDTPWQREFEDQFPFELTPDQEQSVREITHDMEQPRNMDRLLVGDVGYGKTEVSLRAAFKAIVDGKQVAILAPTTILAQQHYNTVRQRFAAFPVRAEVISRFRTAKEQRAILKDLAEGKIDLLVGTHRLLAKDVKFKNLGLLIVDEEQRFGVQHKETIKQLKTQVDVLTLSATPIPRTLHMSMVGIRDMSVLQTPPEDRLPVQTHVAEYSDALVRDAILRELGRGGQVYFLYNRVQSIERFYQRLRALVPEARIGVAHGQMREQVLEDVMMDFYAGSYDVLLCTTIIESGLDVPTANTLIVYDAERFGLSQLYQLRGRVGRSSRQAYAYFTVRQDKILSEAAEERLSAIREFTEFGAGFRIALRDLEIRGAGNILGPEQHGHLATIGYEMYCKLMEEAMAEARGIPDRSELETRVNLHVDAFLPTEYIADELQRMEIYRRIAALSTEADREDIVDELIDRYGNPPAVVETLLDVSQLRALLSRLGVTQAWAAPGALTMRVDSAFVPDPLLLWQAMHESDPRLQIPQRPLNTLLMQGTWASERALLRDAVLTFRKVVARLDQLQTEQQQKDTEKTRPEA